MVTTLADAQELIIAQGQQLETLAAQVASLTEALKASQAVTERQQHQLNAYVERLYGRSSEQHDPNQLNFDLELLAGLPDPSSSDAADASAADDNQGLPPPPSRPKKKRKPHGRLPIPEHLPREVVVLDVPEKDKICPRTGRPMVCIGHDDTERMEFRPGHAVVKVYRRPKYASPDRAQGHHVGIVTAPLPDHPIPKCKAECGLIAYAIVSKFADHLPFYRQDDIWDREGVDIARSTLDGWALQVGDVLAPLGDALRKAVLDTDVLFTDDTVIPLIQKGRGRTTQARMWVYIRGGPDPKLVAYDFTTDRRKIRPLDYLEDFQGYIHADAYSGYKELFSRDGITAAACWCHARRRFHDAITSRPEEASEVLALIARMYQWEEKHRALSHAQRHQQRQETVAPIVHAILERVETLRTRSLPSEPLSKACEYVHNQADALRTFLEDGRLEADNNTAENAIRPLAIGRRNWLFAGSERGGRMAALYFGLIQSCKVCNVNPWQYFDDILRRIMSHPVSQLPQLLPDQWKPLKRDANGLIITD